MALPDAEFMRALTPLGVLLLVVLIITWAGISDRNARIREIQVAAKLMVERAERETQRWREAYGSSELARNRQAEALREALEVGRTATLAVEGVRRALERTNREGAGPG